MTTRGGEGTKGAPGREVVLSQRLKPFSSRFAPPAWKTKLFRRITWAQRASGQAIVLHGEPHAFAAMFYRDGVIAYPRKLRPKEIQAFQDAGYFIVE